MAHKKATKKVEPKKKPQPRPVNPFDRFAVKPVAKSFVTMVNEAVKLNNQYAALVQQYTQKQNEVALRKKYVKNLKKGNIKTPLMMQTMDGLFEPVYDIKQLTKQLENKNKIVTQSLLLIDDQVSHWYDEYRDSMIRVYQVLGGILGKDKEVKNVSGHRKNLADKGKETKIFEKDFEKLTDADITKLKEYAVKNTKQ